MKTDRSTLLNVGLTVAVMFTAIAGVERSASADGSGNGTPTNPLATGNLINISTPDILASEQVGFRGDVRAFSDAAGTVVFSPSLRYGLSNNWEIGLGASLAPYQNFYVPGGGLTRYGGNDVEVSAKYATQVAGKYGIGFQAGIGLPNTPFQKSTQLTVGATGTVAAGSSLNLYVNPRAVLLTDNSILGIGLGASVKLSQQLSWIGDYTPIISGSNSVDPFTGDSRRRDIYGFALRYVTMSSNVTLDLGWTNGMGTTTGSSLTPGFGNSAAWYVSLNFKR